MKKVLLGSVAALGATLAVASAAQAQLEVTIGGYIRFDAGVYSDDMDGIYRFAPGELATDGPDRTDFDFRSRARIQIDVRGVADNGLIYGGRVRLDGRRDTSSNADQHFVFVSGNWGTLQFGDLDGASDNMKITLPGYGPGTGADGQWQDFAGWSVGNAWKPIDSGAATKIVYYTPRFSGFQFGIAYAPRSNADGGTGNQVAVWDDDDAVTNFLDAGINYVGNFGGVSVSAGGTYSYADGGSDREDLNAFGLGLNVGFGGFTVGAQYVYQGDSLLEKGSDVSTWAWGVGATYGQGPWQVGINYLYANFDGRPINWVGLNNVMTDRAYAITFGGGYTIAPGLSLGADIVYFNARSDNDFDFFDTEVGGVGVGFQGTGRLNNDGWVGVTRLNAAF